MFLFYYKFIKKKYEITYMPMTIKRQWWAKSIFCSKRTLNFYKVSSEVIFFKALLMVLSSIV